MKDARSAASDYRRLLEAIFRTAVDSVAPGPALHRALDAAEILPPARSWIIAAGKAAPAMADAAVAHLARQGAAVAGGLVVPSGPADPPHPDIAVVPGDHPLPGDASVRAALALGAITRRVAPGDVVHVLLSGGATSLLAAPVEEISGSDLRESYRGLLGSGLDIHAMNHLRKRISRWGAGRLALALAHARVRVYALSDVIGDDVGAIGSGPCEPDATTAGELLALVRVAALRDVLPGSVIRLLEHTRDGRMAETPKPGDPAFATVRSEVIAGNGTAVDAAASAARAAGLDVVRIGQAMSGEASDVGSAVARELIAIAERHEPGAPPACVILGGETTVTLTGRHGTGGRCQELALSAASVIAAAAGRCSIALLAAGTDGRDGPTDAAGAIVDTATWRAIRTNGPDPADALRGHDAYSALHSAGALLTTGPTGTNVADLVIGVADSMRRPDPDQP